MAHKINKIEITNFKAFAGEPFTLKLNGNNLLLYGENGSGKSSIYWSLYTMLQSCLKKQDITEAGKYFDPSNPENLRNRYSNAADDSSIKIEFIDMDDDRTSGYTDSKDVINTASGDDMFMFHTLASSEFINYKFLYSIFNFRNSQDADIFEVFERDIFPTMEFSESLHSVTDEDKETQNARDWWNYLTKEALGELDRYQNQNFKPIGPKYRKHGEYLEKFNRMLKVYVGRIQINANELLAEGKLALPLEIQLEYIPMTFNKQLARGSRKRDEKITPPRIILTAKLKDSTLSEVEKNVSHPHTFLNEARLARMALAMRFAIINMKNDGEAARGAQILCIDDMLISLDMSNRLDVVDYILDTYSQDYQLLFMTHDRALYRIMENKIQTLKLDSKWIKKELYCVEEELSETGCPKIEMYNKKDSISKAKYHYRQHDYCACANTLRSECESRLRRMLPHNLQLDANCEALDFSGLLDKLPEFYTLYGICGGGLPSLDIYREHMLNPLSHDDLSSNVYREEMKRCINDMEVLSKYRKKNIVTCADGAEEFYIEMGGYVVRFEIREIWDYVQDASGEKFYKNVPVYIKASTITAHVEGQECPVKSLFNDMCNRARIPEDARPDWLSVIKHVGDDKPLSDY